jgi:circadian clock protein KaiC
MEGFDEITKGGLPCGQTTLIEGAADTGKTIMALQSLAYAARFHNEPGIFVAFEERPERIMAFGLGENRACDLDHELRVLGGVNTK